MSVNVGLLVITKVPVTPAAHDDKREAGGMWGGDTQLDFDHSKKIRLFKTYIKKAGEINNN